MTIQEYFGDWSRVVDLKEADNNVKRLISSGNIICPDVKNIFKAFLLCPMSSLRVVILSQDPYPDIFHNKPRATGIAFANTVDTPEDSISPSLKILKESVIDYTVPHNTITFDNSLEKWEKQGVLLLNTALTCNVGKIGSHMLLWRPFTTSFLSRLSKEIPGIVYVLMGNSAIGMETYIDNRFNHILKCRHPSYYARTKTQMPSDIWKKINSILIDANGYGIEWYEEN